MLSDRSTQDDVQKQAPLGHLFQIYPILNNLHLIRVSQNSLFLTNTYLKLNLRDLMLIFLKICLHKAWKLQYRFQRYIVVGAY